MGAVDRPPPPGHEDTRRRLRHVVRGRPGDEDRWDGLLDLGHDRARGDAVVAEIDASAAAGTSAEVPHAVFVTSDLAATPDVLRTFAAAVTEAAGGRLDALVHNAALCPPVDTVSLTDADLEATLAVNDRAPHVLTAALAPAMAERDQGAIVVIGSWMAHIGHPFVGLYSATKAAEIQLARSWAAEFDPAGSGSTASPPVRRGRRSTRPMGTSSLR